MIRRATLDDCMAIEDLFLRAKRRTEFCTVRVNFEKARKNLRRCIQSAVGFAMVAEHDGEISGALCGVLTDFWYADERYATDMGFVSRRRGDGKALLGQFVAWANTKGVFVLMATSSLRAGKVLRALYEGEGLRRVGEAFVTNKPIVVPNLNIGRSYGT